MKIVLLEPLGIPAEVLAHYQARLRPKAIPWFVTGRGPQTRRSSSAVPGTVISPSSPTPPIPPRWWRGLPVKAAQRGLYRVGPCGPRGLPGQRGHCMQRGRILHPVRGGTGAGADHCLPAPAAVTWRRPPAAAVQEPLPRPGDCRAHRGDCRHRRHWHAHSAALPGLRRPGYCLFPDPPTGGGAPRCDVCFPWRSCCSKATSSPSTCPAMGETKGLLSRQRLAMMKPSAILINVARAPSWTTWLWPRR